MRTEGVEHGLQCGQFLSSNAQDFIEDAYNDSQTALTQYS
ncbi:hypothetical protein HMPREF9003_0003 [Bifidobacterium dentium JCVIHMP022]|uniref:Uncharacterized protein n=1 Tax=Bifidobacterium dentium JCVIHMP022 TaxID=553191 RepID=A0AB72Z0Z9_9BIFI|nr:hypothetical protein HMPREF9003_0003 [Bifidobacterium dentium JCVIHMP022]